MSEKFNFKKVLTISLGHMSHDIFSSFLAPLLPLLISKLGITLSLSAFLDIARKVPSLLNPLFGWMVEKTDMKYIVILTPSITAISMCLLGVVESYYLLIVLLFISGISSALFHIPSPVMIRESSGKRIGLGMSFYMVGGEAARTLGPLILTGALALWGLEGVYKVIPLGLLTSLFLFIALRDVEVKKIVKNEKTIVENSRKERVKKYIPFFIALALFAIFQSAVKSILTLYLPTYLTNRGYSLTFGGIALAFLQFAGVIGVMGAGYISDKIGRRKMLIIVTTGSSIFMTLLYQTIDSLNPLPFLMLTGLFLFGTGPLILSYVHDTKSSKPSFINSVYMAINFGVSSLVVLFVGYLGDNYGLNFSFKIAIFLYLLLFPTILLLDKSFQKVKNID
ncbi:MAG: MFS transporter [Candidatus Cloacimonadota bacterium]|nr:MAG: MFS transporter [Candidatus Cloacimonadota bacterium]PIE82046.1 MAG: MFS transporter [Candidatus Delongbacteria bacterium]